LQFEFQLQLGIELREQLWRRLRRRMWRLRELKAMDLPALGVGLGYRAPHFSELFLHRDEVDFLEITVDHFFEASAEKDAQLALLADHFTLIPHGLNLSLGTAEGLDGAYVEKFAALVARVRPPWWSEHLAFTRAAASRSAT